MVWYCHLLKNFPQFVVIHTVNGFGIVNKAEIDVFLERSCFFDDPVDVGNLVFGSSAFSKTRLNIRKFMVHVLLKPGLENFEHYFTSAALMYALRPEALDCSAELLCHKRSWTILPYSILDISYCWSSI